MSPLSFDALAGRYVLCPGQYPGIQGQRPVLGSGVLTHILRGRTGLGLVRTVGSVFTLCAHAHQRVAALAWNAACPTAGQLPIASLSAHRLETVRDHLRSMALDWPARVELAQQQANGLLALLQCPVMSVRNESRLAQGTNDLFAELREWLAANFATSAQSPLLFLNDWTTQALGLQPLLHPLEVLHHDAQEQRIRLQELADAMQRIPDFVQRPTWRGQCAETGCWTRLRHRSGHRPDCHLNWPDAATSAWLRLTARWREVLEIAQAAPLPGDARDDPLLSSGALALGQGAALAWCEMARGLLLHWLRVDDNGTVLDYRVLAPTEWNFHPQGALASMLSTLAPDDRRAAQCLGTAFDACVDCRIDGAA